MTRNGKIARLEETLRNELNQRLADGQEGAEILEWINALPKVRTMLKSLFNGAPINKQNLSEWRQGGFKEWEIHRDLIDNALGAADCVNEIRENVEGLLIDNVATLLAARYAAVLRGWNGDPDARITQQLQLLGEMCTAITRLQRNTHRAAEHQFELDKLQDDCEKTEDQAEKHERLMPMWASRRLAMLASTLGNTPEAEKQAFEIVAVENEMSVEALKAVVMEWHVRTSGSRSSRVKPSQTKSRKPASPEVSELDSALSDFDIASEPPSSP